MSLKTFYDYVTNKKLRNSATYSNYQHLLLSKAILYQKKHLRQIKLEIIVSNMNGSINYHLVQRLV